LETSALTRRSFTGLGLGAAVATASGGVLAQAGPTPSTASDRPAPLTSAPVSQAGLGPRLTLHAIDNFHGTPAAGMVCDLAWREGDSLTPIKTVTTGSTAGRPSRC
jgi:5-hydroxyisourate hydrolase